ncbi:unnamed protein product, partial [Ixodes persulcatus]
DLGLPGRLLHGLLLDALEGISFLTDQVASLGEENKRLRAETKRVSERQATLVCSMRDEVRACRAEIAGWRRAAGGAAPASSNVPALILRNGVPPAGNLPRWGSAGSSSGGPPASLGSVRDHRVNLTASQDGERDGRVARLEPMLPRPKARTAALTGASETTKLCVASPSRSLRALFVTKLAPDTICEGVSSHLSSVGIDKVECRRLKNRFDTYASFHVAAAAEDFEKLADPAVWKKKLVCSLSVWPKSCLFKPFRGTLRRDMLHASEGPPTTGDK